MEMDNSLREAMMQMVQLQSQSLQVLQQIKTNGDVNMSQAYSLPSAASLTSYQNYAGAYQAQFATPFGPSQDLVSEFSNYKNQLMTKSSDNTFWNLYVKGNMNRANTMTREMALANTTSNVANATIAGTGAVAGSFAEFGGFMLPGALGLGGAGGMILGMGLGTVVGAGVTATTKAMLEGAKQAQAYNKYMIQNSYRFINPLESSVPGGGFARQDRWAAAQTLRHMDYQLNISDDEVSGLLSQYTEAGLLQSASNVESFGKTFKQLTQYVKSAALTLNEAYEDTAALMGEFQKRGILAKDFTAAASAGRIAGAYTGLSAAEAAGINLNIAQGVTAGTTGSTAAVYGLSSYVMSSVGAAYNAAIANGDTRLSNTIANLGGAEGATNAIVQSMYSRFGNSNSIEFQIGMLGYDQNGNFSNATFNANYANYVNSGYKEEFLRDHIESIYNYRDLTTAIAYDPSRMMSQINSSTYTKILAGAQGLYHNRYGDELDIADLFTKYGYSPTDSLLIQAILGQNAAGFTPEAYEAQVATNQWISNMQSNYVGPVQAVKNLFRHIGDTLGDPGQAIAEEFDAMGRSISRFINPLNIAAENIGLYRGAMGASDAEAARAATKAIDITNRIDFNDSALLGLSSGGNPLSINATIRALDRAAKYANGDEYMEASAELASALKGYQGEQAAYTFIGSLFGMSNRELKKAGAFKNYEDQTVEDVINESNLLKTTVIGSLKNKDKRTILQDLNMNGAVLQDETIERLMSIESNDKFVEELANTLFKAMQGDTSEMRMQTTNEILGEISQNVQKISGTVSNGNYPSSAGLTTR